MEEYKLLHKKKKTVPFYQKFLLSAFNKILICTIFVLLALIACKKSNYKDLLYKYVYSSNFSFLRIEELYQKYFGKLLPVPDATFPTEVVSSNEMSYDSLEEIEGGVQLQVGKGSTISALESGLVVFVGEKEGYGQVLILEQVDGVEAWYVGVDTPDAKIYDYVEAESILGSSMGDTISLYFKKKGESVDYKNYIS